MFAYDRLSQRLQAIAQHPGSTLRCLGDVDGLPFWRLDLTTPKPRMRVCLASGIHGDEPAGVEALLRFLEAPPALPIHVTAFPCMNPTGLKRGTRRDRWGRDLNRCFEVPLSEDQAPQGPVAFFKASVQDEVWDLYLDLHEDDRSQGFYLYEVITPCSPLAPHVIRRLRAGGHPVEPADTLQRLMAEENHPFGPTSQDGVVAVPASAVSQSEVPQAPWMIGSHAPQGLTFESPSRAPWETRVAMHLSALVATLEAALSPD